MTWVRGCCLNQNSGYITIEGTDLDSRTRVYFIVNVIVSESHNVHNIN